MMQETGPATGKVSSAPTANEANGSPAELETKTGAV
jgi:hypothetical protein